MAVTIVFAVAERVFSLKLTDRDTETLRCVEKKNPGLTSSLLGGPNGRPITLLQRSSVISDLLLLQHELKELEASLGSKFVVESVRSGGERSRTSTGRAGRLNGIPVSIKVFPDKCMLQKLRVNQAQEVEVFEESLLADGDTLELDSGVKVLIKKEWSGGSLVDSARNLFEFLERMGGSQVRREIVG